MTREEYIRLEDTYGASNYSPLDVIFTKAKGVWVWDNDGNRYLDFVSAYSAVNHGHCHSKILATVKDQAERLSLVSRAFRNDQIGPFSEQICKLSDSKKVLFMNTGAEAVETALKAVRKWGYTSKGVASGKAEIIVCDENFHGRTIAIVGFSSVEKYKKGFGPFPRGFKRIPFGDSEAFEKAITPNTVGFLVEPIQGEGGMNTPPDGYLTRIREIATKNNVALMFDEIQCGLARTGSIFAEDYERVRSDVLIIGKSLGGGYCPISAVLARGDILDVFAPGEHGSTFGGNPFACAVGRTALDVMIEEDLSGNALIMGKYFRKRLGKQIGKTIVSIKGRGLMLGLELNADSPGASAVAKKLLSKGLICNAASATVLRLTPPLTIQEEEADWALDRLEAGLAEFA
jgi:ornithine--oxo-acid transaminase